MIGIQSEREERPSLAAQGAKARCSGARPFEADRFIVKKSVEVRKRDPESDPGADLGADLGRVRSSR